MLRQPNRRYKVSRKRGDERCVAAWTNCFKIRQLAEIYLGHDLSTKMVQVDEEPIHMNVPGSTEAKTLEHLGAPSVALRTNHSASSERAIVMTCALSCEVLATADARQPIAMCIKAQPAQRGEAIELPRYTNCSLDWTTSGSYDRVRFLSYLQCWLEKWAQVRAELNAYRFLFVDVAACHLGGEIVEYGWQCGHVLVYHHGGTTSVRQVPDTHIHQPCFTVVLGVGTRAVYQAALV